MFCFFTGVAHVEDQLALEVFADRSNDVRLLFPEKVAAHQMNKGQAVVVQALGEPGNQTDRITVLHALEAVEGAQSNTDVLGTEHSGYGFNHLQQKSGAIFDRATVGAFSMVGAITQELVQQIAVGAMNLNTVKAGALGILGGGAETVDDGRDFAVGQCAGNRVGLLTFRCVHFIAGDGNGAGRYRILAVV